MGLLVLGARWPLNFSEVRQRDEEDSERCCGYFIEIGKRRRRALEPASVSTRAPCQCEIRNMRSALSGHFVEAVINE